MSTVTALILGASSALAAPCESVESASASTAYQKVDALFSAKIVTDQLQAIGMSNEQALARVSQLSERQLEELAAQADLIQVGGTIQSGHLNKLGPLSYILDQAKVLLCNIYRFLFCWTTLK